MPEKIRSFYALFPVNSLIPFMEKTVQQNFPLLLYLACRSINFTSPQAHVFLITKQNLGRLQKKTHKCLRPFRGFFQADPPIISTSTDVNALKLHLLKIIKKKVTLQPHFSGVLFIYNRKINSNSALLQVDFLKIKHSELK